MSDMRGGTVLVTGASSGLGAAIAAAVAKGDWRVICAARRLDKLAAQVEAIGAAATSVSLDVRDKESVATLLERVPEGWREVDVLVNCAGHDIGGRQRFDLGSMDDWADTLNTNLLGAMRVTHAVVPGMLQRGRGHIVNMSSIYALEAHAGSSAYCTSKYGINGFSKAILDDYRNQGVRVTQILPGVARTEFSDTRWHGDRSKIDAFYASVPVVLEPEDIARAVLFAIEQPRHVTIADIVMVAGS
jgi:3-hydroxy acid dehydrogenase/malonic semialdehyde reductase